VPLTYFLELEKHESRDPPSGTSPVDGGGH